MSKQSAGSKQGTSRTQLHKTLSCPLTHHASTAAATIIDSSAWWPTAISPSRLRQSIDRHCLQLIDTNCCQQPLKRLAPQHNGVDSVRELSCTWTTIAVKTVHYCCRNGGKSDSQHELMRFPCVELLSRLDVTNLQCMSPLQFFWRSSPTDAHDTDPLSAQIFPGYSYENPSRFQGGCELVGIPLSHGRHLGNLGPLSLLL